jgi:hypothetical protein
MGPMQDAESELFVPFRLIEKQNSQMQPAVNNSMNPTQFQQKIAGLLTYNKRSETFQCVRTERPCDICQQTVPDPRLACFGTVRNDKIMLTHKCVTCNRVLFSGNGKRKPGTWDPAYALTRKNKPVIRPNKNDSAK